MEYFNALYVFVTILVVTSLFVFAVDDLFIDLYAWFKGLKPYLMTTDELVKLKHLPEKRLGILIANWKEAEVIGPMLRGNIRYLDYKNYIFYVGVYPNDTETWKAALAAQEQYPEFVKVIVNTLPGPTSKGQLLNEMVRQLIETREVFDALILQDSEDLLHPHSLTLMNAHLEKADFVQIPVFSLNVPHSKLVGGVYIDEFAESHTKDLLVREALGAAIPSAGVGTCVSRKLVETLVGIQGEFLNPHTLTEDYHLGLVTKLLKFKSKFACVLYEKESGQKQFIATREYFPDGFQASVRQKSRWTLGIVFQGFENIGWLGSRVDRYFLWRDRRGPFNSVVVVLAALFAIWTGVIWMFEGHSSILQNPIIASLLIFNLTSMFIRLGQRARAVWTVNGKEHVPLVPLRWFVGNIINVGATFKAVSQYVRSKRTGEAPRWIKTEHKLPEDFGRELEVNS